MKRSRRLVVGLAATLSAAPVAVASQTSLPHGGADSVVVAAGTRYQSGGLHRWLLGNTYRDLWSAPVRVPILDLRTYAGGLRPLKAGGGNQTKSLRLINPEGAEYVFRLVDKARVQTPRGLEGTVVDHIFRDQVSASHPGAALVAAPLLEAAGVLHATPMLAVMPEDTLLGEFRSDFAGRLGMIEPFPNKPKHAAGFADAVKIINSDELLQLMDSDPRQRIDLIAFLAARLMDMLFNDWDRHPGQWKWARLRPGAANPWEPIPRDRDKVFVSSSGVIPGIARLAAPNLVPFESTYPSVRALTWNSIEFDRRLLVGVERSTWDSVAGALVRRVSDSVIDAAFRTLPPEYQSSAPLLARNLKLRRDALPQAARRFYLAIAAVAEVHGTDAADRATVRLIDDRHIAVQLQSSGEAPYFARRFAEDETQEIRIYLHGGDDTAVVQGSVQRSIPIRVIGGNGTNVLTDSATIGGARNRVRLIDVGHVTGVRYGPDTLFHRRPWITERGRLVEPARDRGDSLVPWFGLTSNRDLGFIPRLGATHYRYDFRHQPYAQALGIQAEYASTVGGFRVALLADRRRESSRLHFVATARMSQLEILDYHGLGNDTPDSGSANPFFEVRQRQWQLLPAVALALGPRSDLSIGPTVQYSVTDSAPNRFVAAARPYGFSAFGQAGLRVNLHYDVRDHPRDPHGGFLLDITGAYYPALWDVGATFGGVSASAATYFTAPIPVHPILVLRGGGKKVFGDFPFQEAAFIGGRTTLRTLDAQRYAGDAAVWGSAELRVPVARFPLVLPFNIGVFGLVDAGRVYVDGQSPGGWHTAAGVGLWIGILDPSTAVRLCRRPSGSGPC